MQSNSNRGRNCCTATQRETRAAWLFLLPSLTGVVLFVLLPFAETVRRSLFDTMGTAWVGLSNYRSVIQNGAFQLAVHNTARFWGFACRFFFQAAWYWRSCSTAVRCGKHGLPASSKPPFAAYCDSCGQHCAVVANLVCPAGVVQRLVDLPGGAAYRFYGDRYSVLGFDRHLSVEKLRVYKHSLDGRAGSDSGRSV